MKAVILDIKGKFAAALSEDGSFVQIKNANYSVGQQIEVQRFILTRAKLITRISTLAACCTLVCGLSWGAFSYLNPIYYISMDVNPSVEYTLNTFNRVLSVQAVNDDGVKILQALNLKNLSNKTIEEVMSLTLTEITREGYLDVNTGGIVIAISGKKTSAAEKLATHLKDLIAAQCADHHRTVSIETMIVDQALFDEARALGVTPGKLLLVQMLLAEHPEIDALSAEEWLKKPVRDIMAALNLNHEDEEDALRDAAEEAADRIKDATDAAKDAAEETTDHKNEAADAAKDAAEKDADHKNEAADAAKDAAEKDADHKNEAADAAKDAAEKDADHKNQAADAAKDAVEKDADHKNQVADAAKDAA
ncbi:MAG: anti-sigma factor domain-containing protein [Clostridia bacterium]